ncbi:MAG: peptidylprolyl isomerase [Bacteroidetes bacterium GWC2_33_15]|nr:MAG: peptidylprolyl isomerase [Bacteroidetes bacterium GWA2_33_15]OFX50618.1 MAG: peptidylprolyl isomerase [Bacteroidetes bacterium GWC2_33_15]OFX64155.1 MAG: peptidylprolyl isomerase [Bacteroidetes bacterium GWB2_32_14]OFX69767.1 MAG: peptidylprolyl isomerase [Bacteroidetes bacterium GWD2_33_33]HAN19804.1 peptidylprolyl isomerase [Bacteroidales bacterium]
MIISNEKVVSLIYQLQVDDNNGDVIETVSEDRPFVFLYGAGNMLPKFEENLNGLKAGDKFEFKIECDDAYGQANDEAVVELPKNIFEIEGKVEDGLLELGNVIPMQSQDGQKLNGVVIEVDDNVVTMDFNHPLAGDDLYFSGHIIEVREATANELKNGYAASEQYEHDHDHDDHEHSCGCGCDH